MTCNCNVPKNRICSGDYCCCTSAIPNLATKISRTNRASWILKVHNYTCHPKCRSFAGLIDSRSSIAFPTTRFLPKTRVNKKKNIFIARLMLNVTSWFLSHVDAESILYTRQSGCNQQWQICRNAIAGWGKVEQHKFRTLKQSPLPPNSKIPVEDSVEIAIKIDCRAKSERWKKNTGYLKQSASKFSLPFPLVVTFSTKIFFDKRDNVMSKN